MTSAELHHILQAKERVLDELEERLIKAESSLEQVANDIQRGKPGPMDPGAQRLLDKQSGVRLALSYVQEMKRR